MPPESQTDVVHAINQKLGETTKSPATIKGIEPSLRQRGDLANIEGVPADEWTTSEHVLRYLDRADASPRRAEGESVLLEHVPRDARRILDRDGRRSPACAAADRSPRGARCGVFANFEHVASASHRLHLAFFAAIDEPLEHEDPSDRLLDVERQLAWLRALGFDDVDCYWKWLEMALLVGVKPA